MNSALLLLVFLSPSGVACPADMGQIRWDGYQHQFNANGKKHTVRGTLWDRDRNGQPSNGDLFRIESAVAGGASMGIDETWVVIKGGLAAEMAKRFKRVSGLRATCESRFEVPKVPTITSGAGLAKHLRSLTSEGEVPPDQRAENDMNQWATEICRPGVHVEKGSLESRLYERASRSHGRVGKNALRAIARDVANAHAMKCAHLAVPKKLTFDGE